MHNAFQQVIISSAAASKLAYKCARCSGCSPATAVPSAFTTQGTRESVPQWVELANGCLCCSVKAEFVQALEALLDGDGGHQGKFDYVLVETTGAVPCLQSNRGMWLKHMHFLRMSVCVPVYVSC